MCKQINTYFFIVLFFLLNCLAITVHSQCLNIVEWGGAPAPIGMTAEKISNCNYAGEFAYVAEIQSGVTYIVNSTTCGDYLTVYDGSGQMVVHGLVPLEFEAPMTGSYAIHFNMDENCGVEGVCRSTSISCLSCGAIAGCMNPIATNYDPNATYDDCSCIVQSISNDDCIGAINLDASANSDGSCSLTSISQYSGATNSVTEVTPSPECSDGDITPADIWFSLTVPASGVVTFEFVETPGFSSVMECYTGVCGSLEAYAPILCNNEEQRIFTELVPGEIVYFRVWDFGSNDVGNYELCIKKEVTGCTDPTANNYSPSATYDDGTCSFPSASKPCLASTLVVNAACTVGDNSGIAMEGGEPAGSCFSGDNSTLWFQFVADSEVTNISTDFPGYTSTDTEIVLYSSTACDDYSSFVEIACDQDGGVIEDYNSTITAAPTTQGETYYVQVSGWNGAEGSFCLEVTSVAANNEICGATLVTCGDVITGNTSLYSMSTTHLPNENCGAGPLTASNAFYVLEGTGEDMNISLCNSSFDTRLDVFCLVGGSCSSTPELVCIAGNDDDPQCGNVSQSEVRFATVDQSKYYIMIHGYGINSGNYEIEMSCDVPVSAPTNQDCDNNGLACRLMGSAELLTVGTSCNSIYGTNEGAAQAIATPICALSGYQSITDVWYQFDTENYFGFELEVQEISGIDVRHALYEICGSEPMFCDQNMLYGLDPNSTYFLQIFTQKGDEGDFEICLKSAEVCAFVIEPIGADVDVNSPLVWSAAENATGYELMIGTSPGSDNFMGLIDVGNILTFTPPTFAYNKTYFATLIPYGPNGSINSCPSFTFKTKCPDIVSAVDAMIDGSCFGVADGAIDLAVTGGEGPYSFLWSGPNGFVNSTEDIVQIMGGNYELTITDDNNGCFIEETFGVEPMVGMTATTNIVSEACGDDGAIEVLVFGGAEPYTYQWSTGSNEPTTTNIPSGNYQVTVTDAEGCTELFDDIIVDSDGELSASVVNITGVGCGTTNGTISISPSTGMSPYDYNWSSTTGAVTGTEVGVNGSYSITSLPVGTYLVTITDVNGCVGYVENLAVNIVEEIELDIIEVEHPDCYTNNNGTIKVNASVGQAPFQFIWSNGVVVSESSGVETLSELDEGSYGVTVTDVYGCTGITEGIEVIEPEALNLVLHSVESPLCFGENSGSVLIDVEGGTTPFTYNWSNGYTTEDLIGVGAGNYLMTLTDANGCSSMTVVATIENPTAIEINLNGMEHNTCFGDDGGSISTGIFGGNPPYAVEWNNGMTSANLDYLPGGDYQCTITDQSGCQLLSPVYTIIEPDSSIELELDSISDSPCNGFEYGAIDVIVSGGTAPYTYHWSNGETTQNINGLSTGYYILTVTDDYDCIFISDLIFVDEPDELQTNNSSTPEINTDANGTANVDVNGGTLPYSYFWDSNTGNQVTATAIGLSADIYMVTVNDVNGCMLVTSVEVESEIISASTDIETIKRIALSPNPTSGESNLLVELEQVEKIQIEVYDMGGKKVLNPQKYEARKLLTIIDLNDQPEGVYLVKVLVGGSNLKTMMLVKTQ